MQRMTCIARTLLLGIAALMMVQITLLPDARAAAPQGASLREFHEHLLSRKPDLEQFRSRGPFDVAVRKNHEVRLSPAERIRADLYLASSVEKAPLLVFLHGHEASKEAHAKQAAHLASWGIHALALQLPKTGPWDSNGRTLARIVSFIHRTPGALDHRIDVNRILLAGHSFGAYAVTFAMAQGAPAAGGILLDAALFGNASPDFLRKLNKPVMILAADEAVSPVRYRDYFFGYIQGNVAEISVKGATHEDAQYPSETSLANAGVDPDTTEALQLTFVSALTATAVSLAANRSLEYAWSAFADAIGSGRFLQPKKK